MRIKRLLVDLRVKMVVPSLAALLADPPIEEGSDIGPFVGTVFGN
jgi:hypothetical protein